MSTIRTVTVYLCGPMTGIDESNHPAFNEAAEQLRAKGYAVFNPAESFGGRTDLPRETYMAISVAALQACDYLALLPEWAWSGGAGCEFDVAQNLGKKTPTVEYLVDRADEILQPAPTAE